jgi:hypothetical protein
MRLHFVLGKERYVRTLLTRNSLAPSGSGTLQLFRATFKHQRLLVPFLVPALLLLPPLELLLLVNDSTGRRTSNDESDTDPSGGAQRRSSITAIMAQS